MAQTRVSFLGLLVVFISFTCIGCWEDPWFCEDRVCPRYTLEHDYKVFEERNYEESYWITTDIPSTHENDVKTGFWKLYDFNNGKNAEKKVIKMSRPVVISVKEADGAGEGQVTIWVFQSNSTIPEPEDNTVKIKVVPSCTVYVRSFGGFADEEEGKDEANKLKEDLKAEGKQFVENHFYAAGYDSPLEWFNRHNEVWYHAG